MRALAGTEFAAYVCQDRVGIERGWEGEDKMMVCFDEHFVKFDAVVADLVNGDPLQRFIVFHEDGREMARFVLRQTGNLTRWEIQAAAKEALQEFRRRRRSPQRLHLALAA